MRETSFESQSSIILHLHEKAECFFEICQEEHKIGYPE